MEEVVNNGEIVATYPAVFVGTAIGAQYLNLSA